MNIYQFLFCFIWGLSATLSLVAWRAIGLDREKWKSELWQELNATNGAILTRSVRKTLITICVIGFLLPVLYPLSSLVLVIVVALF